MAIELKARLACSRRLKKRLALDERKARDVATVDMQEIESVIDEVHSTFAVGRRLGIGEARQSVVFDAAQSVGRGAAVAADGQLAAHLSREMFLHPL
jgi:hypothetical protein